MALLLIDFLIDFGCFYAYVEARTIGQHAWMSVAKRPPASYCVWNVTATNRPCASHTVHTVSVYIHCNIHNMLSSSRRQKHSPGGVCTHCLSRRSYADGSACCDDNNSQCNYPNQMDYSSPSVLKKSVITLFVAMEATGAVYRQDCYTIAIHFASSADTDPCHID